MSYGYKVLGARMEIRLNFLELTKPEELNMAMRIPDLTSEEAQDRFNELFSFAERILSDPGNRHSMDVILPPHPLIYLWKFFFGNRPNPELISKDRNKVIFKDFQTGVIYELSIQRLIPSP